MNATRQQLETWDREHFWHPFTQMQQYAEERPLIIERAEGFELIDVDGNRYIDGVSSLWCNVHGHQVPELDEAIRLQLGKVAHSTTLGPSNVPAIELARRLVEITPEGLNRVFYSDSGATAVEIALKMAFQFWQQCDDPRPNKTKFLSLGEAYHGDTVGSVSVGGMDLFHSKFRPLLFETIQSPPPYCYRCPLRLEPATCEVECLNHLVSLIEQHHEELAAVIIEPLVQGAAGMITAPDGFLERVRDATRTNSVLLIADEVAVAFGRTGTMFACEQVGITPDILCLAKGITGGYLPLAATLTTDEIFNAFLGKPDDYKTFYHGHTYTGNPLGAAVALANLDLFYKEDDEGRNLLEELPGKIALLKQKLDKIGELEWVGEVRQKGLMVGIELVKDRETKESFPAPELVGRKVCLDARNHGVLIRPLGDVVILMPPPAIDLISLDRICDAVFHSIKRTCAAKAA